MCVELENGSPKSECELEIQDLCLEIDQHLASRGEGRSPSNEAKGINYHPLVNQIDSLSNSIQLQLGIQFFYNHSIVFEIK